ncbi:zinc finger protein 333-like [Micropterus salmoides]|uniref:zinc finger protein 333-like n=1 Tax=Micropterus salmoides TaxID=27706 RepID=UPI0018ECF411|nr:zinc finger protein 333-like [Micropterus salmoides]XP_038583263.1 zinc finger protein 333-like [Micropterus salmoides]
MSKVQTLRAFVQQRLSAAAEEIFELFERTIAEYEEELCGQRKLLDAVFKPEVRLHRAEVQLLLLKKDDVPPEQQGWCPGLDQEDPQEPPNSPSLDQEDPPEPPHIKSDWSPSLDQDDPPEPPHIKEEQEELWTSPEGEQLLGLEEEFTFTPVLMKSEEDNEERPQSSQLHQRLTEQMKTEADGEDCGGPEPASNSDPHRYLQPATHVRTSCSSEPQTDEICEWQGTMETRSGVNPLKINSGCNTVGKSFSCSKCSKVFRHNSGLKRHMRIHTGEKSFSCFVCGRRFAHKFQLRQHLTVHSGGTPFSCIGETLAKSSDLTSHLRVHTGGKPFTCSVCKSSFRSRRNLSRHMRIHTGEKPFCCSICNKRFIRLDYVKKHKCDGKNSGSK